MLLEPIRQMIISLLTFYLKKIFFHIKAGISNIFFGKMEKLFIVEWIWIPGKYTL